MSEYREFVKSKRLRVADTGFSVGDNDLPAKLFQWQRDIVRFAARTGRCGLFEECGLGKTAQQLAWADAAVRFGGARRVLILCPLAVQFQTLREAAKFGIEAAVKVCREQRQVESGISIANYERLHLFDTSQFAAVVLDESGILKSFMGKTKQQLCNSFSGLKYKLACTATPAPNDLLELGNHAAFLDVMPANEMIARWFSNNSMEAGEYSLKPHGAGDFWRWLASFAVALSSPADLGFAAAGFDLPPLNIREHVVEASMATPAGMLFNAQALTATTMHQEKRATASARAAKVADFANNTQEPFIVWCDSNYEADELRRAIPDAIEVRGSDSPESKEEKLESFSSGESRVIITKPEIAGFGLNWQHCHRVAFIGLTFSYERFYQAVRRSWRFGQTKPVEVEIVSSEAEHAISAAVWQKQKQHGQMKAGMVEAMRESQLESVYGRRELAAYSASERMSVPAWAAMKRTTKGESV